MYKLSNDKGKPGETRGRKAIGPSKDGSQLPKGEFVLFKRVLGLLHLLIIILFLVGQAPVAASEVFDLKNIEKGVLGVNRPLNDKKLKVMVQRDNTTYYYNLSGDKDVFPLQLGSGDYKLALLENLSGNSYAVKYNENVQVKLANDKIPFLQSASPVYWEDHSKAAKLAQKLTENLEGDKEKARAIYDHIVDNIGYDKDKIDGLSSDYVPSVDDVLSSGKAICYDYAALYAAMLRSIDMPAKLVKGYKDDIDTYHAWNEVYLKDMGWVTVDTTYDAVLKENGTSCKFAKDVNEYKREKEY